MQLNESSPAPPSPASFRRRVVIVDDHAFFAACLRALLDNESDLVVCDVTSNPEELEDRVKRLRPDLLVIDLSLGVTDGLELGRRLRAEHGIATPIVFTSSLAGPTPAELAGIRWCTFVAKTRSPAQFLSALRELLAVAAPPAAASGVVRLIQVNS